MFYIFVFYIMSDLYNHHSTMFLFFIVSVYISSVYIVSFYKFVFDIFGVHQRFLLPDMSIKTY